MRASTATMAGSVISGVLASACCIGPVVFALLGISGAAAVQRFEPLRPYLLGATYLLSYDVSYERGEASVTCEPAKTGPQKIAESISKTGFRATVKGGQAAMPRNSKSVGGVDLQALKDWFNASQGSVRFVSLLSPSCPMCQSGHGVLKTVFGDTKSPDLKGFIVWLPMLSGDDEAAVTGQSATFHDDRVGEGWDRARRVGDAFARSLELQGTAWDVYLVYDRNVRWDGADPPTPSFWMHQLREKVGADPKLCLNPARLRREVAARVAQR